MRCARRASGSGVELRRPSSLAEAEGVLIAGGTEVVPLLRAGILRADELVDVPDEHLTNLGSKGLGEPPIVPTAAAIANAIRDATGADIRELPISREEMLRALREAREREKRGAPATV